MDIINKPELSYNILRTDILLDTDLDSSKSIPSTIKDVIKNNHSIPNCYKCNSQLNFLNHIYLDDVINEFICLKCYDKLDVSERISKKMTAYYSFYLHYRNYFKKETLKN